MIKAVLADIDNTLLDFDKCAEYAMKCAFEEAGLQYTENAAEVFFRINTQLWNEIEKGNLDKAGLYKIRWRRIFKELKTEYDGEKFEMSFVKHLGDSYQTVDGAKDILDYLSDRYPLYAASNGPQTEQINRLTNAGLVHYFKDIFTSERIGYQKPRREFFEGCFRKMDGVLPCETIIIGDSVNADIKGGKDSGLVTCFFNYKQRHSLQCISADYVVQTLDDIKNFL